MLEACIPTRKNVSEWLQMDMRVLLCLKRKPTFLNILGVSIVDANRLLYRPLI